MTRNQTEANLTQECPPKAFRAFGPFADGMNLKAWIFPILRNTFFTSPTFPGWWCSRYRPVAFALLGAIFSEPVR